MTRKKFVKKIMAYGVQRNAAEAMARQFVSRGYSYAEATQHMGLQLKQKVFYATEAWERLRMKRGVASPFKSRHDGLRSVITLVDEVHTMPTPYIYLDTKILAPAVQAVALIQKRDGGVKHGHV